jgi:hypothetical protein
MRLGIPLATIAQFEFNWRDADQYDRQISYKEAEANARRSAAAVNATSALSTESLEAGIVDALLKFVTDLAEYKIPEPYFAAQELVKEIGDK